MYDRSKSFEGRAQFDIRAYLFGYPCYLFYTSIMMNHEMTPLVFLQLEEESIKGSNLILFPPADGQTQEFHLQTMVQDIGASLLMEFEKWVLQAESGGTILKTPLDSQASLSSEEV